MRNDYTFYIDQHAACNILSVNHTVSVDPPTVCSSYTVDVLVNIVEDCSPVCALTNDHYLKHTNTQLVSIYIYPLTLVRPSPLVSPSFILVGLVSDSTIIAYLSVYFFLCDTDGANQSQDWYPVAFHH